MKKKIAVIYSTIMLVFICGCTQAQVNKDESNLKMLKEFYTLYISESAKKKPDIKYLNVLKSKYCSENLLRKINADDFDYDILLNAQDCDQNWLHTLAVVKGRQVGWYDVSYIDNYSKKKNVISVKVIKDKNQLKIDAVL